MDKNDIVKKDLGVNGEGPAILKHSNKISEMPLQGFTAHEIDLFFGLCYFVQNKGEEEVVISFNELRSLLGIERRGDKKLKEEMQETALKFSRISITEESDAEFYTIVPFYGFRINTKKKTFAVQVHRDFVKALNGLNGGPGNRYTLSDVRAIAGMSNAFTKQALKMIFHYRNTGYWFVTLENLRYYLDVPASYKSGNINQRVIEPIKRDFLASGIFEEFEIIENKDESQTGVGRKKVVGYTFHFKFREDYFVNDYISDSKAIKCPRCGRPLRRIKRKDGKYFYGHPGGHKAGAACSFTTSDVLDLPDSAVETVSERNESDVPGVSHSELERYYRHIRSEEQEALRQRCERARTEDPELWALYEERERGLSDLVSSMGFMRLTDRSPEEMSLRDALEQKKERLAEALGERGLEADYFEIHYRCPECKDYGTTPDGMFCSCRKERVIEAKEWLKTQQG